MKHSRSTRDERPQGSAKKIVGGGEPIAPGREAIAKTPPAEEPGVERHEAIWLDGRVPNGYWDQPTNRRRYMHWLGQRLRFHRREDWYRITTDDFKFNRGGALLSHWNSSAICAVEDTFRDYDWKPWLFQIAPRHFWQDPENHRTYMQWLGEQLGIREPSDWYRVTNQDFKDHGGGGFLLSYDCTVSSAVMSYLPEYDWKEWMFDKTPKGFWRDPNNRRRYMRWLASELGYRTLDDWYAVTVKDFAAHYGKQFLKRYGSSPLRALRDCFPEHMWHEWRFARVPVGFWNDLKNCRRYVRWLGQELEVQSLSDWLKVRRRDLLTNYGGGLLFVYHSYRDLLVQCVPGLERVAGRQDAEELPSLSGVRDLRPGAQDSGTRCSGRRDDRWPAARAQRTTRRGPRPGDGAGHMEACLGRNAE